MSLSQTPTRSPARACLALIVLFLQLVGALHFTLVRHGYSAALGGVVHVHGLAARPPQTSPPPAERRPALSAGIPSCGAELCPLATAPHAAVPNLSLPASGDVDFGEARLLGAGAARSPLSRRVFRSAPKTSPPA